MSMQHGTSLVRAISVLFSAGLIVSGCSPSEQSGSPYPTGWLDVSDANNQILDTLTSRFLALAGEESDSTAVSALVAELQAGSAKGVSATLGDDGCTIFLRLPDGSVALLNTNRAVFGSKDALSAASGARTGRKMPAIAAGDLRRTGRMIPATFACPGHDTPEKRNVLIVNTAAVSNPSTNEYVQQIQNALADQGWQPGEIDVRTRDGDGDRTFTPFSLTSVAGYGMVFIIAQGCRADPGGGNHSYIQCCRSGSYMDVLTADALGEVIGDRDTGRLIRCETPRESGGFVREIYIRDDCLVEKMSLAPGALVYFVAPHSWSAAQGLAERDAGATLGWEGAFGGDDGLRALLGMLSRMTADNTWTTDQQAYQNLIMSGLGLSADPAGRASQARIAGTDGDFYLPAWGSFAIDTANFPADAVDAEVEVTYAACPDFLLTFTIAVGDTVDTLRLPSGEATISVKARNIAGEVLGTGRQTTPINGGRNDIPLATCKATVRLYLNEYPKTGDDAVARLRVEFVYPYPLSDPPLPAELSLSSVAGWSADIWAGSVTVRATALNAAGRVVGRQTRDVDLMCGDETIDLCFGWARLAATRYPADTASIRVTSDNADAPGPFTFAPGGSAIASGLTVDGVVNFTAEARDADGGVIASREQTATIACGENAVPLDLLNYGIIVSADPDTINDDGVDTSHITATLRYWQAGDTTAPTGRPVVGKAVTFATTLGTLTGANPATTDANGRARIDLTGTAAGLADVHAVVADDLEEGKCVVQIGNPTLARSLDVTYAAPGQEQPGAAGAVNALLKDARGNRAPGVPVHFRLVTGTVQLVEPLDVLSNENGVASVVVRSDGPAIGLVEVTVPGTLLIRHCVAYLQFTCSLSPTYSNIEVDNGEVMLDANPTVDLAAAGMPCEWGWPQYPRKGRLIRGGTAAVDGGAVIEPVEGTARARVCRGNEPGTGLGIFANVSCEVDGKWKPILSCGQEVRVEFYQNVIATLPISIESRSKTIAGFPTRYQAKVVARFVGSGPANNIRYLVINPNDHGQVGGDWYDGNNRRAVNTTSQVSIVVNQALYNETQPPDDWLASKVAAYQDAYGGLSISISSYPGTVTPVAGDLSARSFDPWEGW